MTRWAPIILCLVFFAMPAWAAPVPEAQYRETMAKLEATQALMLATIDDFRKGMSAEDARARLPKLQARLQWIRDAKVEAAKSDASATLRRLSAERRRAACIIQRSGAMDEPLQDIVVNASLKARGVTDAELLPLDRKAVEGLSVGSGCRG